MLTIRDLKMAYGGRVLFEDASFTVNYGDRVALVGPNGAGKTTLFSIILRQLEPDAGTVERDEWTMVGHLPQEAEANGDETILEVATGKVDELPRLEKRLHELETAGNVSGPEYLEAHAKHDALNDPQVEVKARKMLRGLGFRESNERRLDHAGAAGAAIGHGTGPPAVGRAHQPPRLARPALAAKLS
jgi:ATP-binding cassette subfamily F protein 3